MLLQHCFHRNVFLWFATAHRADRRTRQRSKTSLCLIGVQAYCAAVGHFRTGTNPSTCHFPCNALNMLAGPSLRQLHCCIVAGESLPACAPSFGAFELAWCSLFICHRRSGPGSVRGAGAAVDNRHLFVLQSSFQLSYPCSHCMKCPTGSSFAACMTRPGVHAGGHRVIWHCALSQRGAHALLTPEWIKAFHHDPLAGAAQDLLDACTGTHAQRPSASGACDGTGHKALHTAGAFANLLVCLCVFISGFRHVAQLCCVHLL